MTIPPGLYAADGSWNVTVVTGASYTGLYALDGSLNVIVSPGTQVTRYHPCGALYVTVSNKTSNNVVHAPDGSLYVQTTPYVQDCGQPVTVVSGSLGAFSLLFQSSATSTAANTTATINYGTMTYATNTRIIIGIGAILNAAGSVSSVTVNGVSASQVVGAVVTSTGDITDIWETNTAVSGTSGNVTVVYSQNPNNFGSISSTVALYSLTTSTPAASSAVHNANAFGTSVSQSIAVPTGGGGLAIGYTQNAATFSSWGNASADGNSTTTYFGHTTFTGSTNSVSFNVTGNDVLLLSLASWSP